MKEYRHLPRNIKDAVESHLSEEEEMQMFFLAGKAMFSSPDYVFITRACREMTSKNGSGISAQTELHQRLFPVSSILNLQENRSQ